jgi:hypothetical protein
MISLAQQSIGVGVAKPCFHTGDSRNAAFTVSGTHSAATLLAADEPMRPAAL